MYDRILLPLDSSELAEQAIEHVQANALAHGSAVHLVQVVDPADLRSPLLRATLERIGNLQEPDRSAGLQAWAQSARSYLEHVGDRLRDAGVRHITTNVIEGNPFDLIPREAIERECDLVVIASHGRSGLGRALIGSVADHVIRNATSYSVLLVAAHEE